MKAVTRLLLKQFARAARPYLKAHGLLQTAKVFNRSALVWEPGNERVVVLAPHMDDETIGCGGTLAQHVARGSQITVIFLTDGSRGGKADSSSGTRTAGPLTEIRRDEARRALQSLGITELHFLDGEDGGLAPTAPLTARLRQLLEASRAELLYLPFFLEEHPDHRAATDILLAAVQGTSLNFRCLGYEVWTPLFPNCLVRIDDTVEQKRAAIGHYLSQLAESDYLHTQLGLNAYRSTALLGGSARYAEAFCALPLQEYRELYNRYRGSEHA